LEELKGMEKYLVQYAHFKDARDIGVVFSTKDITMEQVAAFSIIENKLKEK